MSSNVFKVNKRALNKQTLLNQCRYEGKQRDRQNLSEEPSAEGLSRKLLIPLQFQRLL